MYYDPNAKIAIYAEGEFGRGRSKTGEGVLRYGHNQVVAVLDSTLAGSKVKDVTMIDSFVPVVSSIEACKQLGAQALLLGTAYTGGRLPELWRTDIKLAIAAGLDIINGLHDFLSEDGEFVNAAAAAGVKLLDVRRPPDNLPVASGRVLTSPAHVVLTVGSDCSVGKMTASLELVRSASKKQRKAGFIATGQTGIMICGRGIAVDRVIGDFMAGAVESLILAEGGENEFLMVEGQGSLVHPGFSGVTLALLHGACPHALVLCHKAGKEKIGETGFPVPPLSDLVSLYEHMASFMRPAKVVGVCLNTAVLDAQEAKRQVSKIEDELNLPCCDPVRDSADRIFDALVRHKENKDARSCSQAVSGA